MYVQYIAHHGSRRVLLLFPLGFLCVCISLLVNAVIGPRRFGYFLDDVILINVCLSSCIHCYMDTLS